jgi:hypothetical protein
MTPRTTSPLPIWRRLLAVLALAAAPLLAACGHTHYYSHHTTVRHVVVHRVVVHHR